MLDTDIRAAAVFALGSLIDAGLSRAVPYESDDAAAERAALEREILAIMHAAAADGAMTVRIECAIAIARAAVPPASPHSKKRHHELIAAAFEAQRERVMSEFSAHQNMLLFQHHGTIYKLPASGARGGGPASITSSRFGAGGRGTPGPASEGVPSSLRFVGEEGSVKSGQAYAQRHHRSMRSADGVGSSCPVSRAPSSVLSPCCL
jgi:hypothetical protein